MTGTRYGIVVTYAATEGVADPVGEYEWIEGFEPKPQRDHLLAETSETAREACVIGEALARDLLGRHGIIAAEVVRLETIELHKVKAADQ